VTRTDALDLLRRLAVGLTPDVAGCSRLLERIAGQEDAEALRDALVELGAEELLDREARP
jgi:hypothetical protein